MVKKKTFTDEDDALLGQLGVEVEAKKPATYTPREERVIAGFEDIQRFVTEHGRTPRHGEGGDIFERLYAVRLDRIRASDEYRALLKPLDSAGLIGDAESAPALAADASDEALLEALGVEPTADDDITQMRHVRAQADRKAAEEVAQRKPCEDFEPFQAVFDQVQKELKLGTRKTARFQHNGKMDPGDLFILNGQKVLVAGSGKSFVTDFEREDRRLRVIYDNATESNLLLRSLQRAMYKDDNGRRILPSDTAKPLLFSDQDEQDDTQSGFIYVLRSLSGHPFIAENREVIHKIGVTGGDVKQRVAGAKKDPTFLLADVELIESYRLANVNRSKLEKLLHQFFADARMDLQLRDRFGEHVEPREWFLIPLPVIQQAIELVMSGEIAHCQYDPATAQIVDRQNDSQP